MSSTFGRTGLDAWDVRDAVSAMRYLETLSRQVRVIKRDVASKFGLLQGNDPAVDKGVADVVSDMDGVLEDMSGLAGTMKSWITERETAFLSSDESAARELARAAEELL